jgi:tRNA (mo5U34)-methyltransferase
MPRRSAMHVPEDLPLERRDLMLNEGWPKMSFIEHRVAHDETNWWAPNHACVEALLRSAGFEIVEQPEHEFYLCRAAPIPRASTIDLDRLTSAVRERAPGS